MLGEPEDVDGKCNARLFISDNHGDNHATIRCQRAPDHAGHLHQEQFEREGGLITITWTADERERCDHGCGQWQHDHKDPDVQCPRDMDDHHRDDCAFCHPGESAQTCATCGKTYYADTGHEARCIDEHAAPREETATATFLDGRDEEAAISAHASSIDAVIPSIASNPVDLTPQADDPPVTATPITTPSIDQVAMLRVLYGFTAVHYRTTRQRAVIKACDVLLSLESEYSASCTQSTAIALVLSEWSRVEHLLQLNNLNPTALTDDERNVFALKIVAHEKVLRSPRT